MKNKLFILLLFLINYCDLYYIQNRTTGCPTLRITNGKVRLRQKGKFARFQCNSGYLLAGEKYSLCVRGTWETPAPKCVRPTCKKVNPPANGFVYPEYQGALLNFYCLPGYVLRGSLTTYCDGSRWSSNLPSCVKSQSEPKFDCDFETPDLCGWTHDLNHDFDWRRQNYKTPSGHVNTGPSFDHTKGPGKDGYYMYTEASSRLINDTARLFSPVYSPLENGFCFTFYYHMYGLTIGQLRVYVKTVNDTTPFNKLKPSFWKSGNMGNRWYKGYVSVDSIYEPFQIVIEGIRGDTFMSDIAIDDVSLLVGNCQENEIDTSTTTEMLEDFTEPMTYDTCQNRCSSEIIDETYNCDCTDTCYDNNTCCPDYNIYCNFDASDFYTESTVATTETDSADIITKHYVTNKTELLSTTTKQTTKIPTASTLQMITKKTEKTTTVTPLKTIPTMKTMKPPIIIKPPIPTKPPIPSKPTSTSRSQNLSTTTVTRPTTKLIKKVTLPKIITTKIPITKSPVKKTTKISAMTKKIETDKNYNEVVKTTKIIKRTTILLEDFTHKSIPLETDYYFTKSIIQAENSQQLLTDDKSVNTLVIFGAVGALILFVLATSTIIYYLRRYGYIGNFRGLGTTRSESMSDVRFLANDEVLDFSLRCPDD